MTQAPPMWPRSSQHSIHEERVLLGATIMVGAATMVGGIPVLGFFGDSRRPPWWSPEYVAPGLFASLVPIGLALFFHPRLGRWFVLAWLPLLAWQRSHVVTAYWTACWLLVLAVTWVERRWRRDGKLTDIETPLRARDAGWGWWIAGALLATAISGYCLSAHHSRMDAIRAFEGACVRDTATAVETLSGAVAVDYRGQRVRIPTIGGYDPAEGSSIAVCVDPRDPTRMQAIDSPPNPGDWLSAAPAPWILVPVGLGFIGVAVRDENPTWRGAVKSFERRTPRIHR